MISRWSGELARPVVRISWRRLVAFALVAVMFASAFGILMTPARAGAPPSIGLPGAFPEYMKYITVNNYRFDPLAETPSIPASLRFDSIPVDQDFYYLVQFNGPVTPAMKSALAETGVTILDYISYNAFIVRADGAAMGRAASLSVVRWTGVFQPAYKLSPRLSEEYGAIVQAALERANSGADAAGGVVTSIGTGVPAKSLSVDSFGAPTSAGAGTGFSPRATAVSSGASARAATLGPAADSKRITVEVASFERTRVSEVLQAASFFGGQQIAYSYSQSGAVRTEIEKGAVGLLARVPGVMFIDRSVQPYVFNDLARWVIQSGDVDTFATPVHDHGIYGTGQTVTLGDTGIDFKHPAFWDNNTPGPDARKVTDYYPACTDHCDDVDNGINHGTHTSGSVAGDDGTWHVYDGTPDGSNGAAGPHDGQAFDAHLQVTDMSDDGFFVYFDTMTAVWQRAVDRDSWIHSNSWGSCCSEYIQESADTDDFIWNNQDFLVVFAAGNSGSGLNSMNPFAGAKNVIAAGATSNGAGLENIASFSSRGPMADGRLKPDVMAPGVSVWSAEGRDPGGDGTGYFQLSGTSMATPTVAGGAALVRQYYMDGWYPTGAAVPVNAFTPSAALIKATLINSAVEMTGSGAYANGESYYPNDNQGFGRVLLDNGLFFAGNTRGLILDDHRAGINTGDSVSYALAVGDSSLPVEITLVWSDFRGTPGTRPNLVNDLDLTVTAPDGTVYRGNQYAGMNPGESSPNPADRDALNNVESVLVITNVQSGLWTVDIAGFNIPQGPQSFALVMTGGIATNRGSIQLDHERYQSTATVNIKVVDTGPNADPGAPDTLTVNVTSTTETTPEVVTLTETSDQSSVFAGSIPLQAGAPVGGDNILQVTDGDTILADYFDADNGLGGSGPVSDSAVVDDTAPAISGVSATGLRFNRATIGWTTDELSSSVLHYGASTPPGTTLSDARRVTDHAITASGLLENTTYYYSVESTDEAGNAALDDNGTAYYSFTTLAKPPTAPPNDEWPQFHNNPPRQGYSPSDVIPPINRVWTDGPFLINRWNGPVFHDGILFSAPLDGTLRARDPYTGEVIWERSLGDDYYYTGTMAASDAGVLYATFYGGSGGSVYALDEFTGETIWKVGRAETGLDFNARIMMGLADGLVFGSSWGGEIYALNASDGSVEWTYQTGQLPFGGATINAGVVYMATIDGTLFALDEFSGALIWSKTLDGTATSSPLFAQGNIYEGTYAGTMFALDAFTGTEVWSTKGFGLIDVSTPAYDGTAIYFGICGSCNFPPSKDEVVSLDATNGSILWRTSISGPMGSSVAYANGFVYGTSWDSSLYVFDAADGKIVDTEHMTAFGSTSFPAVSDGWVWVEDNDGNIYAFFGQIPVGLIVSPSRARHETVPTSTIEYPLAVKNVGSLGSDTFDATVTLGSLGWAVDLFQADGTTPLADTDSDGIPDTGLLASGGSAGVVVRVTVPGTDTVRPGDAETTLVAFTSSTNPLKSKTSHLTTIVPAPGVAIGPRAYFTPKPGDTVGASMNVSNKGGFDDTIDVIGSSSMGWTVRLYQADGVTPLADTDGDGIPDVGLVPGLSAAAIAFEVDVPAGVPQDTLQVAAIIGTSSLNTNVSGTGFAVIELVAPPDDVWPTFHNNNKRAGVSPSPHDPPMTEHWRSSANTQHLWTGPVVDNGILYSTTLDGYIRARDPWSGDVIWERALGDTFYYTGTPVVANGVVYATFYGFAGGYVYALNAADGTTIWSVGQRDSGLDFNARVAMVYSDGLVIGSAWGNQNDGQVYALDAATGAKVWEVTASGLPFGGATVGLGAVFQGTTGGQVLAIDLASGAVRWTTTLDNTVTSPPLFAQGNLFVGTYAGTMYSLDALTGDVIWSTGGFNLIDFSTPAYDGTSLYFGDFGMEYVSLDVATGAVNWRTSIGGPVGSSVAYANGYVYGTSWDGYFRTLDAKTGAVVDTDKLAAFASTSMPAVSRGWVWVEDYDGRIYGFGGVGAGDLRSVVVTPDLSSVPVGRAALFKAKGIDAFANPIPVDSVVWSSLADLGSVLPLSGDTAIYIAGTEAGTDTLQAEAKGFAGTASITVTPGPLDRVAVAPAVATIVAGGQTAFSASGVDRYGNPIPGGSFTWSVEGGIGQISPAGVFTASTTTGTGTVTAHSGTQQGSAIIQIVPGPAVKVAVSPSGLSLAAGSTTVLVASVQDLYDNEVATGTLIWSFNGGSLVHLTGDRRMVQYTAPTTPGTVEITASQSGATPAIVRVTVTAGPAASISIVTPARTVSAAGTIDLDATVSDVYGNKLQNVAIEWDTTQGSIDSEGVLTAPKSVGTVFVTATAAGRVAIRAIEVVAGPLSALVVSIPSVTVQTGSGTLLSARGEDANHNEVDVPGLAWSTTIGRIDVTSDGRVVSFVAGDTGGTGTITVTGGGKSQTVSVTVTESILPLGRQATSATSLVFLVVAILGIAGTVFMFVRHREMSRRLEDMRRGGLGGGPGGMG
jgi:outer membrane protein assembly factor BamB